MLVWLTNVSSSKKYCNAENACRNGMLQVGVTEVLFHIENNLKKCNNPRTLITCRVIIIININLFTLIFDISMYPKETYFWYALYNGYKFIFLSRLNVLLFQTKMTAITKTALCKTHTTEKTILNWIRVTLRLFFFNETKTFWKENETLKKKKYFFLVIFFEKARRRRRLHYNSMVELYVVDSIVIRTLWSSFTVFSSERVLTCFVIIWKEKKIESPWN